MYKRHIVIKVHLLVITRKEKYVMRFYKKKKKENQNKLQQSLLERIYITVRSIKDNRRTVVRKWADHPIVLAVLLMKIIVFRFTPTKRTPDYMSVYTFP